jgi:enoyl-CoA hydratase/carnithine racemase
MALTRDQLVHLAIDGEVARLTLDRPPVNAFDPTLVDALGEAVRELAGSDARVAVFSGQGPSLAAGGDIKWMYEQTRARDGKALRSFFRAIQSTFDDIDRLPMPTIAQVHGMTLGGGFEVALACDLRVAADDARVGFPEATLGLIPGAGGTQRLTEIVGRPTALELLYTGRVLSSAEAKELRLLNRVVPTAELESAVDQLVSEILRSTPAAATAVKACVRTLLQDGRDAGFRVERAAVETLAFDDDAVNLLTAFVERRRSA